jgi:hypothetical protein
MQCCYHGQACLLGKRRQRCREAHQVVEVNQVWTDALEGLAKGIFEKCMAERGAKDRLGITFWYPRSQDADPLPHLSV